jgi:hypothetical protein
MFNNILIFFYIFNIYFYILKIYLSCDGMHANKRARIVYYRVWIFLYILKKKTLARALELCTKEGSINMGDHLYISCFLASWWLVCLFF